jgi:hypothetical protein
MAHGMISLLSTVVFPNECSIDLQRHLTGWYNSVRQMGANGTLIAAIFLLRNGVIPSDSNCFFVTGKMKRGKMKGTRTASPGWWLCRLPPPSERNVDRRAHGVIARPRSEPPIVRG